MVRASTRLQVLIFRFTMYPYHFEYPVEPPDAFYHRELGEFILPYEKVRTTSSPDDAIRAFVDSTYDRAATLAKWDRAALERAAPVTNEARARRTRHR